MNGFYRIAAATPCLSLGDPSANAKTLARLAKDAAKDGVSAIVFPELCLTGYTCGDMFFRDDLLHAASDALDSFAAKTANLPIVSIVGLPIAEGSAIYNAAAVVHGGKIVARVRKRALPNYGEYYERRQFTPAPADEPLRIFDVGAFRFGVEICEDLWTPVPPSSLMAEMGVDVVFNLSASTDFLGKSQKRRSLVEQQSLRLGCAYAMACAGTGESSSDAVFGGGSLIAVEGRTVAEAKLFGNAPQIAEATVDMTALRHRRRSSSSVYCAHSVPGGLVDLHPDLPVDAALAAMQSRLHPRCGTTFILFVICISILLHAVLVPLFLGWYMPESAWLKHAYTLLLKFALIIPVASLAYELIRFAGKMKDGWLATVLRAPGMALQLLTTAEPDREELEVAVVALKEALGAGSEFEVNAVPYRLQ